MLVKMGPTALQPRVDSTWMRLLGLVFCLLSSGCYFLYPAKLPPAHKGDLVIPGEEIKIKTREVKVYTSGCTDSAIKAGRCDIDKSGKLKSYQMATKYRLKYGGKNLNYAEVRELADPEFPKQLATMKKNKRACTVSLVPSALAVASAAAGILIPLLEAGKLSDTEKKYFYAGGGAGFVVFGALSYPLGGYACRNSHNTIKAGFDWTKDDYYGEGDIFDKLVSDFNARVRTGGVVAKTTEETPDPQPPVETPVETPAETPNDLDVFTPGTSTIMKTLADAGDYAQFSALLVETGIDRQLASGGPYTVVALGDKVFAKVKKKLDGLDKAERLQMFRDLVFVGVVSSGERTLKTLGGKTLKVELRKNGALKVRGKSGTSRLVGNATNGVVYVID